MAQDMDLDANDLIDAKTGLYTFLCTYTAGSVKRSVRRFRQKGVSEAYRKMHFEGMKLTPKNLSMKRPNNGKLRR